VALVFLPGFDLAADNMIWPFGLRMKCGGVGMWLAERSKTFGTMGINRLLMLVSLYIVVMDNDRLWSTLWLLLGRHLTGHLLFILSVGLLLFALTLLILSLFSFAPIVKPVVIIVLLLSSVGAYYMNNLPVVASNTMVPMPVPASLNGIDAWLDTGLIWHVMLFGLLPSVFVYLARIESASLAAESLSRIRLLSVVSLVLTLSIFWAYRDYSALARQNTSLRYLINPVYPLVSLYSYVKSEPAEAADSCKRTALEPENVAFAGHCPDGPGARAASVPAQRRESAGQ